MCLSRVWLYHTAIRPRQGRAGHTAMAARRGLVPKEVTPRCRPLTRRDTGRSRDRKSLLRKHWLSRREGDGYRNAHAILTGSPAHYPAVIMLRRDRHLLQLRPRQGLARIESDFTIKNNGVPSGRRQSLRRRRHLPNISSGIPAATIDGSRPAIMRGTGATRPFSICDV